jgi:uncharacterized membrane protein
MTALMPFHLFYSQEMRMYSQLFLLSSLEVLCQARLWRDRRSFWWPLYLLVSLLGLYTHYFLLYSLACWGFTLSCAGGLPTQAHAGGISF